MGTIAIGPSLRTVAGVTEAGAVETTTETTTREPSPLERDAADTARPTSLGGWRVVSRSALEREGHESRGADGPRAFGRIP
jgi:hypothetical protein